MKARRAVLAAGVLALLGLLQGCAPIGGEVWEHDVLAKPEMQLDASATDRALDDHIYFSKEGSSGGRSFGGGGCGCN